MPTSLSIGAFVLGGVLLLVSIIRGGFKLFGAEVSGSAGAIGRIVAFIAGVTLILAGFFSGAEKAPGDQVKTDQPIQQGSTLPTSTAALDQRAPVQQVAEPEPRGDDATSAVGRAIDIETRLGTQEIAQIVARLSDQEKLALWGNALATGEDVYAVHLKITNTGNAPIAIEPSRVHLRYNGADIPLSTMDDEHFLRRVTLEPNHYTQGILTFRMNMYTAGLVVSSSRVFYDDASVQVRYH